MNLSVDLQNSFECSLNNVLQFVGKSNYVETYQNEKFSLKLQNICWLFMQSAWCRRKNSNRNWLERTFFLSNFRKTNFRMIWRLKHCFAKELKAGVKLSLSMKMFSQTFWTISTKLTMNRFKCFLTSMLWFIKVKLQAEMFWIFTRQVLFKVKKGKSKKKLKLLCYRSAEHSFHQVLWKWQNFQFSNDKVCWRKRWKLEVSFSRQRELRRGFVRKADWSRFVPRQNLQSWGSWCRPGDFQLHAIRSVARSRKLPRVANFFNLLSILKCPERIWRRGECQRKTFKDTAAHWRNGELCVHRVLQKVQLFPVDIVGWVGTLKLIPPHSN